MTRELWHSSLRPPSRFAPSNPLRPKGLACASVPQCALSERADGSGERGSRCPRVCNAAPRSADWCRKLIEGGAEERVAALRDGRGVQRATVAGEPR